MRKDPRQWNNLAGDAGHVVTKNELKKWLPERNAPHFRAE